MAESRQYEALTMSCVFPAIAAVFVALRTYSRYLGRNFGWDDYLIWISMLLLIGQSLTIYRFIQTSHTGFHVWDIPKQSTGQKITTLKWSFAVQMFYHPLMGSIRASMIMFLFRMKDNRRRIRISLHIVFWLNVGYTVGTSIANVLQCNPVSYTWLRPEMDQYDANGKVIAVGGQCIQSRTFVLASCALSIFMDLIIIPIPSIMVWNLQMRAKTKALVVLVMSMGWIATGVSVGRFIVYYYRFAPSNTDRTWDIGVVISIAEPAIHIVTACAPATKSLFRILFPSFDSMYRTTAYEDHYVPSKSKLGSHADAPCKRTPALSFGISRGAYEEGTMVASERRASLTNEEDAFGMRALANVDSRDQIVGSHASRSGRANTMHSKGESDVLEAEPKHIFGQAV